MSWFRVFTCASIVLAVSTPVSSHTGDGGNTSLVHACVHTVNGNVRIVGPTGTCRVPEAPTHWPASAPSGAGGSIVVHGTTVTVQGSNPGSFVVGIGTTGTYRVPRDGTVQNLRILVELNTFDGDTVVTIFVNGTPTAVAGTIPAGSTADVDVAAAVGVVDGDRIAVVGDHSTVTTGSIRLAVSYEVQ